jgi:hypothetical protein
MTIFIPGNTAVEDTRGLAQLPAHRPQSAHESMQSVHVSVMTALSPTMIP